MKLQTIDREACKQIRKSLDEALEKVSEEYGMNFTLGTIRFSMNDLRATVKGVLQESYTPAIPTIRPNPLPPFNGEFDRTLLYTVQGKQYEIVDINYRRPKFPYVVARVSDGKRFKMGADMLRNAVTTPK
jgi:hypothetical protein